MKILDKNNLPPCDVELALGVLANKWVVLILERLSHGKMRSCLHRLIKYRQKC